MATNEQNIAYALQEQKDYDVFHWVLPGNKFLAANDITDYFMLYLHSVDGWCAWGEKSVTSNNNEKKKKSEPTETIRRRKNCEAVEDDVPEVSLLSEMKGRFSGDGEETLFLTLQMVHMGQAITPLLQSSHTHGDAQTLNEFIIFPIRLCDVPLDAAVRCCVYSCRGLVGRTLFYPFTAQGELKTGQQRYQLLTGSAEKPSKKATPQHSLLARDFRRGLIQAVPWIDKLVEQRLEAMEKTQESCNISVKTCDRAPPTLLLTFPMLRDKIPVFMLSVPREIVATASRFKLLAQTPTQPFLDFSMNEENVCETKAHVLSRSLFLVADADAQPGPVERRQLQGIVSRPLIQLDGPKVDEETLLWRFRFFLTRDPAYFVPFMRCVNWTNKDERREAIKVMQLWKPISFSQALVCLSFYFAGILCVRQHAIRSLGEQSDEQILHFLLQLVQGVLYDVSNELEQFLTHRALNCWELCSTLFWYIYVEASLKNPVGASGVCAAKKERYVFFLQNFTDVLMEKRPLFLKRIERQKKLMEVLRLLYRTILKDPRDRTKKMELAKMLIDAKKCGVHEFFAGSYEHSNRAADGANIATLPTHPCFVVEHITSDDFYLFKSAKMPMKVSFVMQSICCSAEDNYNDQNSAGAVKAAQLSESDSTTAPSVPGFTPLALSSAQVSVIFKVGDDVRQDQLVVQLVRRIDNMLRQDGLDLCLTPYCVLATGPTEGLVELVPDVVTLQSVQRDITGFIRLHNQTAEMYEAAMSRFTKSFAGYCVLTFILGIGDRHLENILVTHNGRLLHIDFGYILGNDPKPFPPPMKINKEMVEALGGPQSERYMEFKSYCCSSYNIIRKHAQLLLSMLLLMANASIPQISGDGKVDPRVNLLKVQDRLQLGLSSQQAAQYIQNVIADSVSSIFANLWDVMHVAAQATRN